MGAVGAQDRLLWQVLLGIIIIVAAVAALALGIRQCIGREKPAEPTKPKAKITIEMVEPASGTSVVGPVGALKFKASGIVDPKKVKVEVSGAKGVVSGSGTDLIWTPSTPLTEPAIPTTYEVNVSGKGIAEANFWFQVIKEEVKPGPEPEPKIEPEKPKVPKADEGWPDTEATLKRAKGGK